MADKFDEKARGAIDAGRELDNHGTRIVVQYEQLRDAFAAALREADRAAREDCATTPAHEAYALFGSWAFDNFWGDGEPGDIEGGDAQEAAISFGLLKRTSEVDAVVTHAEDCDWCSDAPTDECSCYVPMFAAIRATINQEGK